MKNNLPMMSVCIPTFNGSGTISRTIDSLRRQDYPADRFEIIVIDDGSSDGSGEMARQAGATVVVLPENAGISAARNAGLEAAGGDIYVSLDDDCIAADNLLNELAKGYQAGNPAGVGSYLIPLAQSTTLIERYMDSTATGPATVITQKDQRSLVGRFASYFRANFRVATTETAERVTVQELFGASASFPVEVLKAVGGWDTSLSGIEDRDISRRIRQAYPGRPFVLMGGAKITHQPDMTLSQYLLRPYRRGPQNFEFHRRNHIHPPIFPFPLVVLALTIVASFFSPWLGLMAALVTPHLLYPWWPYRALKSGKPADIVFAYIQLAEEGMVIAGLLRGYMISRRRSRTAASAR
jgi:glycosyltransferase involved in cell wall biosynthesis